MSKQIEIDGKEYTIDCNAYTRFLYKKTFGVGMMEDIKRLTEYSDKQTNLEKELKKKKLTDEEVQAQVNLAMMESADVFIDIIEKFAYILILTANPNFGTFEDFLRGITTIDLSSSWISEVTETAVNSFR